MKHTLLAAITVITLFSSCKKEEPVSQYPMNFQFAKVSNVSDITVFTNKGVINFPKHRTATSDEMAYFQEYVISETTANTGSSITLTSADRAEIRHGQQVTRLPYEIKGNYLIIANSMYYKMTTSSLTKTDIRAVMSNSTGITSFTKSMPNFGTTVSTVQGFMTSSDTASARSYDYVYKR